MLPATVAQRREAKPRPVADVTAPWIPEAWIRSQGFVDAFPEEQDPVAYVTQGRWIREIWDLLSRALDPATPGVDLIAATELRAEPSFAPHAMTDRGYKDGHPIVRVHYGLPAWAFEVVRVITPFLVAADDLDRPVSSDAEGNIEWATPNIDLKEVAGRLAYSLSWLTSRANHPYKLSGPPLSSLQERYAQHIGYAAVLFAVAHEMGHICAGEIRREPNPQKSRDRDTLPTCGPLSGSSPLGT